ncbi:DUF72 domain-containing protein [Fimbriimonas ginsengisoli]|uniref:DUF72 domain-containing protein n=1 Tax=Fimbriimonas ginsengisoli Gsoil 348 TaxID=661478 RepID=A0A068NUM3_FIMGI|nr:DUF72 domain-containing protein [Fimbriimonas ginsengisoli]AIE87238.1 hypothetical protein OP10G_3870 [Fimbriimonas ginsengisoli Gsoil 348]
MEKMYIGLSGFSYPEWKGEGLFYPPTVKAADFLRYYATRYNALESVGTFRQIPSESSVSKWIDATPAGFKVSPKMLESVTHRARLKPEGMTALHDFIKAIEPAERAGKLGPILVQLPPNMKRNDDLLAAFLSDIPHRDTLTWAIEFRNESWQAPEIEAMLRAKNIAWVAEDTDKADAQRRDTAAHLYVRLRRLDYSDDQLQEWAAYLKSEAAEGKDCYVYCRHKDVEAPWLWADRLQELMK